MPIKTWAESDFTSPEERSRHVLRTLDQWRVAMNCWYWLVGPGSTAQRGTFIREGRHQWFVDDEQRKADIDRRLHGWDYDTLRDVRLQNDARRARHFFGGTSQARPRKSKGSDPTLSGDQLASGSSQTLLPSIERDVPETFDIPDDQRVMMRLAATSGKLPFREMKALEQAAVEVLYDGHNEEGEAGWSEEAPF